uniref:SET domain-containing protein n=1 Tax=Chaetoceros debilis TaxID=122233 RepID=A0A7S3PY28_9STRA|mmetsp:Transcript_11343/g.16482  ORF Transcript_11343/g.16482 Transcript_11343/m.16482 type:complete len:353 (+) Transcript_11343:98-1156(+)
MVPFLGVISTALLALQSPEIRRPKSATSAEYSQLLSWLDGTFPSSFVNPSVEIQTSERGGHGMFATDDIKEGSMLFSIPREACITSTTVLDDEACGKSFQTLIDKAGPGAFTVSLAGYLSKEYMRYLEGDDDVLFGPYLATLPWKRNINGQEHVLFWTNDEIETKLSSSLCYREANDLKSEVKVARKILNSIIGIEVLKARGEWEEEKPLIPFLEFTKPPPAALKDPVSGLGRAVTGAFAILLSRAFDDEFDKLIVAEDAERLIPILDMLNHDNDPSITYKTNEEGVVEVKARRDISTGEEIYNRYREEEEMNMPYHRFFTRFGFVPGSTTDDVMALLADKSSVFFAKRKEI